MRLRLVGLLLAVLACGDVAGPPTPPRILYIGNSLTYANDLPNIVAAIAGADGQLVPDYSTVAFGGYSLGDHLQEGTAVRALQSRKWDYVVMQQGPSSLDDSRAQLISDVEKFQVYIQAAGARAALYSVWPESTRFEVFDRVDTSYSLAAQAVSGLLIPAGESWQAAWRQDGTLPLYGDDKFHPSLMGSYVAALAIYSRIYNRTPVGLPSGIVVNSANVGTLQWPGSTTAILQQAVADANKAFSSPSSGATPR